jgi:hypothetical protein
LVPEEASLRLRRSECPEVVVRKPGLLLCISHGPRQRRLEGSREAVSTTATKAISLLSRASPRLLHSASPEGPGEPGHAASSEAPGDGTADERRREQDADDGSGDRTLSPTMVRLALEGLRVALGVLGDKSGIGHIEPFFGHRLEPLLPVPSSSTRRRYRWCCRDQQR